MNTFEAKTHLTHLLDWVAAGEQITITCLNQGSRDVLAPPRRRCSSIIIAFAS
jgi:antitoxin (DNA-binding transcriptional repressor) of toxin-antitoxin stability system